MNNISTINGYKYLKIFHFVKLCKLFTNELFCTLIYAYMQNNTLRKQLARSLRALMDASITLQGQGAVAKKSGIAQATISRILKQQVAATIDNVERIANAFGVEPAALLVETCTAKETEEWRQELNTLPPAEREMVMQFIRFTLSQHNANKPKKTLNAIITNDQVNDDMADAAINSASRPVGSSKTTLSYETENQKMDKKQTQ